MLLSALKNAQIDKREAPLTEDEENAIVKERDQAGQGDHRDSTGRPRRYHR